MEDRWARRRQEQAAGPPWVPEDPADAGGAYAQPVATPVDAPAGADAGRRDWEYVVVQLPHKLKDRDREWTTAVNRVAGEGWRLVTVAMEPNPYGGLWYAAFERPWRDG